MRVLIDARPLDLYGVANAKFTGGTEQYVKVLAHGLADRGHEVGLICPDLAYSEKRGNVGYWTGRNHPEVNDVLVCVHSLEFVGDSSAPVLAFSSNGGDRPNGEAQYVDGVACFSQAHADMLTHNVPEFAGKCHVTGLGLALPTWPRLTQPEYGRLLWGNDPSRGLWHMLDIFDAVKAQVPEATLHVTYDFDRQFEFWRWQASSVAELLWECKRRMADDPRIASLGACTDDDMLREKLECHVGILPSDPQNVGTQTHSMLALELAGYGCPLVLSDVEALPEVFGSAATILPVPNTMARVAGKDTLGRFDAKDWAEVVVGLMKDKKRYAKAAKASRALAEANTWDRWLDNWETWLTGLVEAAPKMQVPVAA